MNELYLSTAPVFIKALSGLENCLDKAVAHGLDEKALLEDRLAPDMFPLVKQVQIACDNAKGVMARLAGIENPKHEDTETTIAELKARIAKTIEFVKSVPESAFAEAHDRKIELQYYPGKYMIGAEYVRDYALQNFFFHVVIAYGLIRKNGVPIGKSDYIFGMPLRDL